MNKVLVTLILFLCLVCTARAEVIFSDDFEWGEDWDSSMPDTLPNTNGWAGVQAVDFGGAYETLYVDTSNHKSGLRGFTQYWDNTGGTTQEGWLINSNLSIPDEFYLGYWFKVDPLWDFGDAANLKILKIHFDNNETWDWGWTNFCAGCPDWGLPTGTIRSICTDEWGRNWFGSWAGIADGEWHYFVWHVDHASGTQTLSVDGSDAAITAYPTDFQGTGFDSVYGLNFGGNLMAGGGAANEMYTSYDNLIMATTETEVLSFLGVSTPTYDQPTISISDTNTGTASSGAITGTYTIDAELSAGLCTWSHSGGSVTGFATVLLGVVSGTVTGLPVGATTVSFSLLDSDDQEATGTALFTRTEATTDVSKGVTIQGVQWNQ